MVLAPGSKGWISKYFSLIEKGEFSIEIQNTQKLNPLKYLHWTFSHSGIVFGIPTHAIFDHQLSTKKWTNEEKLKVLLFEAHLFTYLLNNEKFDKKEFVRQLLVFYEKHQSSSFQSIFSFFSKNTPEEILENILSKRVDIKLDIIGNKWWVNSLNNGFAYLDVILFHDFLTSNNTDAIKNYANFAQNALTVLILAIYADGKVDEGEKDMFQLFLASAHLSDGHRNIIKERFKKGASFDDLPTSIHRNWLLKKYLMDVALLSVYSSREELVESEKEFIEKLRKFLSIPKDELEESSMFIENYLLANKEATEVFTGIPAYEKVLDNFSSKWKKILLRNKDKVAKELSESKELVGLIKDSMVRELSSEEKKRMNRQLKDLLKTMPAVTIFLVPGGSILLPMMVKLIPDLLPSTFRDNKLEE